MKYDFTTFTGKNGTPATFSEHCAEITAELRDIINRGDQISPEKYAIQKAMRMPGWDEAGGFLQGCGVVFLTKYAKNFIDGLPNFELAAIEWAREEPSELARAKAHCPKGTLMDLFKWHIENKYSDDEYFNDQSFLRF